MGVTQTKAIASKVKAHTDLLWPVPANWSLKDAATVPLAYSMAFYILVSLLKTVIDSLILLKGLIFTLCG